MARSRKQLNITQSPLPQNAKNRATHGDIFNQSPNTLFFTDYSASINGDEESENYITIWPHPVGFKNGTMRGNWIKELPYLSEYSYFKECFRQKANVGTEGANEKFQVWDVFKELPITRQKYIISCLWFNPHNITEPVGLPVIPT
ncbi:hypothetical protein B0H11DRAFT_1902557 [Mycena galericulata]|nr:hypothetical protein B0H11DRAFT_1902557 [Mycena galericulata]